MGREKDIIDSMDHWPIMEAMIKHNLKPGQMISSPLREGDKHPSFGLFRDQKSRQARWKDFAMEGGDVYALAKEMFGLNFSESVQYIAGVAGVSKEMTYQKITRKPFFKKVQEKIPAKCTFIKRVPTTRDQEFWLRFGIDIADARKYGLYPCEVFTSQSSKGDFVYRNTADNPMYVYAIGDNLKLYRPLNPNPKTKYIGNTTARDVFGLEYLEAQVRQNGPFVIGGIVGGQKDALTVAYNLGVPCCLSMNSESTLGDDKLMFRIFKLAKRWFIMYDNDLTGLKNSERLFLKFPFDKNIELSSFTLENDISNVRERDPVALEAIKKELLLLTNKPN